MQPRELVCSAIEFLALVLTGSAIGALIGVAIRLCRVG